MRDVKVRGEKSPDCERKIADEKMRGEKHHIDFINNVIFL